ncbi:hypothetical protein KJ359_010860 [Pestalotiopsis sp. 9143b]|nr:hypothetical protein KJ359_010860 [Pestalotiopsis sp. 9143b]
MSLRTALENLARANPSLGDTPFDSTNSVVFFRFRTYYQFDYKAAKMITTYGPPIADVEVPTPANKRNEGSSNITAPLSPDHIHGMTMEEVDALVAAGFAEEDFVHANMTHFESLASIGTEDPFWEGFQPESNSSFGAFDVDTTKLDNVQNKRAPIVRKISEERITPLWKRASPQDLDDARLVVQNALNQSSKLNQERMAKPLRNIYGLRPGTIVGQGTAAYPNITANSDVIPLLTITPEIVQAAALVAEADVGANPGNMTKRAVSGSYWMEHLARKGTVPWGDDPDYRVFRNVVDYGAVGDGVTVSQSIEATNALLVLTQPLPGRYQSDTKRHE